MLLKKLKSLVNKQGKTKNHFAEFNKMVEINSKQVKKPVEDIV